MKKIFAVLLAVVMVFSLAACGNMSLGLGNYEFKKIHVDTHSYSGCLEVTKWYDTSTGIEVHTKDYGPLFFSEGTYFLVGEDCPICDESTGK